MTAMDTLLLANTESLFLDRLELVAGSPLAFVAYVVFVFGWVLRAYFRRTQKYLAGLERFPDRDKLTALQMLALGFPKTLTPNRMKVLGWQYMLGALVATLFTIVTLAGLAVHYWPLPKGEIERRLGRIDQTTAKTATNVEELKDTTSRIASTLERQSKHIERIDAAGAELQKERDKEKQRSLQLTGGVRVAADWADELARSNPEILELANTLAALVETFEAEFGEGELSEVDDLRLRLAKATLANAEGRFQETLHIVTEEDAQAEREATEAQIDQEIRTNQVRGDAFYGLRKWHQARACYERILELREDDDDALWNRGLCYWQARDFADAQKCFETLVHAYSAQLKEGNHGVATHLGLARYNLGTNLLHQWKFAQAVIVFDKALRELKPLQEKDVRADTAASIARGHVNRAIARQGVDDLSGAIDDCNDAIEILNRLGEPSEKRFAFVLANAYENRGLAQKRQGKLDAAIVDLDETVRIRLSIADDEYLAGTYDNRAVALAWRKRYADAIPDHNAAVAIYERLLVEERRRDLVADLARGYVNRGNTQFYLEDLDFAIADFSRAIKLFQQEEVQSVSDVVDFVKAHTNRGWVLKEQGKLDAAREDAKQAVKLRQGLLDRGWMDTEGELAPLEKLLTSLRETKEKEKGGQLKKGEKGGQAYLFRVRYRAGARRDGRTLANRRWQDRRLIQPLGGHGPPYSAAVRPVERTPRLSSPDIDQCPITCLKPPL